MCSGTLKSSPPPSPSSSSPLPSISYVHLLLALTVAHLLQGLQLTQLTLAHEKYMDHATHRVAALEAQLAALRESKK